MKLSKRISVMLVALFISMAMMLSGCGANELSENIKVGSLIGPTGMGLIDLMDDKNIDLELYQSPTDVTQKLVSGELDVACVPSNLGAVLYAKTKGQVQVLTTVCNGVLYVLENGKTIKSVADLKGKTIIGSGQGGTPEYALQAILEKSGLTLGEDVQVQWLEDHAAVAQKVASTTGTIGLLPEPMVSLVTAKATTVRVALDMNTLWTEMTGHELPMGILIAKKEYVTEHRASIDTMLDLVDASIKDVNNGSDAVVKKIVDAGIVQDENLCKAVIPNCSLVRMSPEDSKTTLSTFYEILFKCEPTSVGGAVPADDIYYGAE